MGSGIFTIWYQWNTKMKYNIQQYVKFVICGCSSNLVELALLYIFTNHLHFWYLISYLISSSISACFTYLSNRFWTFKGSSITIQSLFSFVIVHVLNILISSSLLFFFTTIVGIYYLISKIMITAMSCIWNYFVSKYLIYK